MLINGSLLVTWSDQKLEIFKLSLMFFTKCNFPFQKCPTRLQIKKLMGMNNKRDTYARMYVYKLCACIDIQYCSKVSYHRNILTHETGLSPMAAWTSHNVLIAICKANKAATLSNLTKFGFWAPAHKLCCFTMFRKDATLEIYRYTRLENGICGYAAKVSVLN